MQDLTTLKLSELKELAKAQGITPKGDKRCKQTWIDALSGKAQPAKSTKQRKSNPKPKAAGSAKKQQPAPTKPTPQRKAKSKPTKQPHSLGFDDLPVVLGEFLELYGTDQYEILKALAVQGAIYNFHLYRALKQRMRDLGLDEVA